MPKRPIDKLGKKRKGKRDARRPKKRNCAWDLASLPSISWLLVWAFEEALCVLDIRTLHAHTQRLHYKKEGQKEDSESERGERQRVNERVSE